MYHNTFFVDGLHRSCAGLQGYEPDASTVKRAEQAGCSQVEVTHDVEQAAKDADVIYTDVWASMGKKEEAEQRVKAFQALQVHQIAEPYRFFA
jgi:ornithine carbamoyltransferase